MKLGFNNQYIHQGNFPSLCMKAINQWSGFRGTSMELQEVGMAVIAEEG